MRWSSRSGAMVIALSLTAHTLALSFDFTDIDDANSTFASRGWLDPGSLFQRNIRAAADLWAARFDSDATIVVDVDPHSYVTRAGGTNTLGRYLFSVEKSSVFGDMLDRPVLMKCLFKPTLHDIDLNPWRSLVN